jgi:predicted  nucleic acid-binding Zn-ribbon protein
MKGWFRPTPVRNHITTIESEISGLNRRLRDLEALMADPDHYRNGRRVIVTNQEYRALRDKIDSLTDAWEGLTIEAEKLTQQFEQELGNLK